MNNVARGEISVFGERAFNMTTLSLKGTEQSVILGVFSHLSSLVS